MKHLFAFLVIVVLFVSGCQPSETAIQTAIAQTQAAKPTSTFTAIPPTETPTETPSSTADLRVIDTDPQKLVLDDADLQKHGLNYIFNPLFDIALTNDDMIASDFYNETDKNLIFTAGRIVGWPRWFWRMEDPKNGYIGLICDVTLYKTASGAQLAVIIYNSAETEPYAWQYQDRKMDLGDTNVIYTSVDSDQVIIDFSFRNVAVEIYLFTDNQDLAEILARDVLKKLQEAPLVNPVYSATSIAPLISTDASSIADTKIIQEKTEGVWLVGIEVAIGKWRAVGGDCYEVTRDSSNNQVDMQSGIGSIINVTSDDYSVEFVSYPDKCTWTYLGK